jgi:hypothetical protein
VPDSDKSGNGDNDIVEEEEDYEEPEAVKPSLQEKQAPSQSDYTGCPSADTTTETPHSPADQMSPTMMMNRMEQINRQCNSQQSCDGHCPLAIKTL